MHSEDLAQFKFSSGQEIVCEVMEWPEENSRDIIVRNAMAIVVGETYDGERVYMFKPWVHFLEKPTEYIVINSFHVVCQNRPSEHLILEYAHAVGEMHMHAKERDMEYRKEKRENVERLQSALKDYVNKQSDDEPEEAKTNIVKFPSKDDTVH